MRPGVLLPIILFLDFVWKSGCPTVSLPRRFSGIVNFVPFFSDWHFFFKMVFLERYLLDWGYRVLVKLSVSYSADEILRPVFPESENFFCVLPQKLFFKKTVVWNATIHCVICMLIFSAICKNWKKTHPINCCSFYPIFTNCVHFLKMLRSLLDFF